MKRVLGICALIFAVAPVLAGVDDTLLTFSTKGPDTYADGTTVLDGECYALVWSADGNFDGVAADGTAADPNDKVVICAKVAKDGHCPNLMYAIDATTAAKLAGGVYGVYLLDTRIKNNDGTVQLAEVTKGQVNSVNSSAVVNGAVATAAKSASLTTSDTVATSVKTTTSAAAPAGAKQPKIEGIEIKGEYAYITISNLPGVARVSGSDDLSKGFVSGGDQAVTPNDDGETATLIKKIDTSKGSGFFKVMGL